MQSRKMLRSLPILFLATSLQAQTPAQEPPSSDCLRMAFGEYCLGGPASTLPPNPAHSGPDMRGWGDPEKQATLVRLFSGRVMSVFRTYRPASWITFDDLASELRKTFGEPSDASEFPDYADTRDSKATAIAVGTGRAVLHWKPASEYRVSLIWSDKGLSVGYLALALQREHDAKAKPKF